MRTGMNLLLWTGHVTNEHFPLLARLKQTGFDGVELPLFEGDAHHYQMISRELKNLGLACTTVTVVGPETSPISPDAKIRQAALDRHKWAIEMTAILGGKTYVGLTTPPSVSLRESDRPARRRSGRPRCSGNRPNSPDNTK